jgi:hypothetical protein
LRLVLLGAEDHALARRQAVGLEHQRVGGARQLGERLLAVAQEDVGGGRHARRFHHLLGEGLRPLQLGGRRARPEGGDPRLLQGVDQSGDQRRLGPDRDQIDRPLARRGDDRLGVPGADLGQALGVGGDPGVARRAEQLRRPRRARQRPHHRVLATTGSDNQHAL